MKEDRKPGYYWVRFKGHHHNCIAQFGIYYGWVCNGVSRQPKDFEWISDEPIREPKPKLIPGKYYVVEFRASKAKDIIQCQNDNMFIAPGSHQRYSFEIVDVLSEGFSPEQVIEKLK
jgi:hypothetical protein